MKKSTPRTKVAEGLRALVSAEDILEAARRLGALQRQRKVDLVALVESTVAAVTPVPGAQTTAFVNDIALTGQKLAPSAFYRTGAAAGDGAGMPQAVSRAPRSARMRGPVWGRCGEVVLMRFRPGGGWGPAPGERRIRQDFPGRAGPRLGTTMTNWKWTPGVSHAPEKRCVVTGPPHGPST